MNQQLQQLFDHLDLEALDDGLLQTRHKSEGWRQIFGGQVLAQALLSASRTVDDARKPHSLHAYFLRPGDKAHPILFKVENLRDGKSFCTRRVTAVQHGAAILTLDDGTESGRIDNSWGPNYFSGPVGWGEPGPEGFWAQSKIIHKMLQYGDSWAFSCVEGFPLRLDWVI